MSSAAVPVGGEVRRGFGGVLGDVRSDRLGMQLGAVSLPVGVAGDRSGIQLCAEAEPSRLVVAVEGGSGVGDLAGGGADEVGQCGRVDVDGGGRVRVEVV